MLDLGTGTSLCAIRAALRKLDIKFIGIDISRNMLKYAQKNINKMKLHRRIYNTNGDIEILNFPDNTFDKIISIYGFGAVKKPTKAFKEVMRVAKPNARITFGEMTRPPKNRGLFWQKVHDIVEWGVDLIWKFRDVNLNQLFRKFKIKIDYLEYKKDRFIGSLTVISGLVNKN